MDPLASGSKTSDSELVAPSAYGTSHTALTALRIARCVTFVLLVTELLLAAVVLVCT